MTVGDPVANGVVQGVGFKPLGASEGLFLQGVAELPFSKGIGNTDGEGKCHSQIWRNRFYM